jgi:uncharacterized spore protein YtfJ
MSELDEVLDAAVDELGRMAKAQACVGDPITAGAYTVIPIASVGFGGGLGRGMGPRAEDRDKGGGGAFGFGGGVRPVAVIIIGPDGVKIEPIPDLDKGDWSQVLGALTDRLTKERRK